MLARACWLEILVYEGDCYVVLNNNTSNTIEDDDSLDKFPETQPKSPVPSGRLSWICFSGWGMALLVSFVAAPAIGSYWFSGDGERVSPFGVSQGVTSSMVSFAIPAKPAEWSQFVDSTQSVVDPVQPVRLAQRLDVPVQHAAEADEPEPVVEPEEPAVEVVAPAAKAEEPAVEVVAPAAKVVAPAAKVEEPVAKVEEPVAEPMDFKFAIQVGSFSEREGAEQLVSELKNKGYDVYVYESWGKKAPIRLWKSVRIGRFQDKKTAGVVLEQYKKKENNPGAYVASHRALSERGKKPAGAIDEPAASIQKPESANKTEESAASVMSDSKLAFQRRPLAGDSAVALEPEEIIKVNERASEAAEHLFQQSLVFQKNRDLVQEELLLQKVLTRDPTHTLARHRLARIFVESGRVADGLAVLKKSVRGRSSAVVVGEDPNLAAFLAALYQQQGEHGKAIDLYRALLQRFPGKGIWRMGMAISMEKVGKPKNALRAYEEALITGDLSEKLRDFVQKRIHRLK